MHCITTVRHMVGWNLLDRAFDPRSPQTNRDRPATGEAARFGSGAPTHIFSLNERPLPSLIVVDPRT